MLMVLRKSRTRSRDATHSTFTLSPFGRRNRYRREKRAKHARKAVVIVHPHTYSDELGGRAQPVLVDTKMEALQSLPPSFVPDYVLSAGLNAARVRRDSQNTRQFSAIRRRGSSLIPLTGSAPPSALGTKGLPPTPTDSCITLTPTIPDVRPPTLTKLTDSTKPLPETGRARKRGRCRKPICRHFVLVWKRLTGVARRVVRRGPDGQTGRESWLPAGFVLIDPRSSWWKKQSTSSKSSKYH